MVQQFCGAEGIFCEGLAVAHEVVGKESFYFHILPNGQPAYEKRYKKTEPFNSGLAWAQKEDGTWIKINKQGQEVLMRNTQEPLV